MGTWLLLCLVLRVSGGLSFPMSCNDITCKADEVCQMTRNKPTCSKKPATCWAMGDPHYRTFDGQFYDFMGTCTYVFAKKCGSEDVLPDFEVLSQNENRGSLQVSYVGAVTVKVYSLTITVIRTETGRVRINYGLWNLPVVLNEGKVVISQIGRFAVIRTDFGLTVKYDWEHHLEVSLPGSYASKTCGLCGNFNGNPSDDYSTPLGKQAIGVSAFGSSWKVPGLRDGGCTDECVGGCDRCESDQIKLFEGELFCGLISLETKSPFSSCHSVVPPQAYLDNCKFDLCMGGGLRTFLCRALETYTEACQNAGVQVQDWRVVARCPSQCPFNSHYELCGTSCPATCADPAAPLKCKSPCVEACTCNTGFVLNGGQCVPTAECGCTYMGRNVPAGVSFWEDQACKKRCRCVPESGRVECQDAGCKEGQQCQVVNGIRDCYPISQSTCQATGDPHYLTFDAQWFDFQGTCVYLLAGLCSSDPGLEPFKVLVQNDFRGSRVVSYTKLVEVKVYSQTISISKEYKGQVVVNGELLNLPASLSEGQVSVYKSGLYAVVTTNFDLKVSFDWNSNVFVTLPSTYQGAVCGLCGNYNNQPQDDLVMRNGQVALDPSKLGESWQVGLVPGCTSGCKGGCQGCTDSQKETYKGQAYCGIITNRQGPFKDCHSKVNPTGFFKNCVFDACHYHGYRGAVCDAVAVYVSACQGQGVHVDSWRTPNFCPLVCPANSQYALCTSACPATCASLFPLYNCKRPCTEGCQCDEGHLLSGDSCVPVAKCGCFYRGHYYRMGDVFYSEDTCLEQCSCGENGAVTCQKAKCRLGEVCKVVNGVQGCYPESKAKCVASGDPHYITFDGRRFDFQGICVYTLAKVCNNDRGRLSSFTVTQGNKKYGDGSVSVTKTVAMEVYDHVVSIEQGVTWRVTVNDEWMNLPLSLSNGRMTVSQEGRNIIVQTDFGLRVLYDTMYYVEVVVPSTYQGKMCGLCGDYNTNPADDFRFPGGIQTENVDDFGHAWAVALPGSVCSGCGGQCPMCSRANANLYGKPESCGIITATGGAFQTCHAKVDPAAYFAHCVYDVCALKGDRETLCQSIQAYSIACQHAGIQIQSWRTTSFCTATCPANSHFEQCADTCASNCASLMATVPCSDTCFEGCICDAGFVSDGDKCVSMETCGCIREGRYLQVGQTVVNKDCNSKCVCQASGVVTCQQVSCASREVCDIRDGVRGCYPKQGNYNGSSQNDPKTADGASSADVAVIVGS